jgi:hypothetical protein
MFENKSSRGCVGAGNVGRKRTSIPNYSVCKPIRKRPQQYTWRLRCMQCFVDEGAPKRNTSLPSNTLKSGFISHFPLIRVSLAPWPLCSIYRSTLLRRVPSGSIRPFSCGFRFAQRAGQLRWLVRERSGGWNGKSSLYSVKVI